MYLVFAIISFILSTNSLAQYVTSSFDHSQLCINPSATTTRSLSQNAFNYAVKGTDSDIVEKRSDNEKYNWKEEIVIDKKELMIIRAKSKVTPEIYIGHNSGVKKLQLAQSSNANGEANENSINFVNNLFNFGLRSSGNLSWGFKFFTPKMSNTNISSTTYSDNKTSSYKNETDYTILGYGLGATARLTQSIYFGFHYVTTKEKYDSTFESTSIDGQSSKSRSNETDKIDRYGFGLSYLRGSSFNGVRFEMAYNYMTLPKFFRGDFPFKFANEFRTSLEFAGRGISAGINMRMVRLNYYDQMDIVDRVFNEPIFNQEFTPSYGGFFSFSSSRGHSFGFSGYAWKQEGERQFRGSKQSASTHILNLGINYAYLY
jgi:hypothetical protein